MVSIGAYAFYKCIGLTSVTIPNSVTSIGDEAFFDCPGLTSVTIPGSVTDVGLSLFRGCAGLRSVTIGNGVTSIGYDEFHGCSSLTSVTIPDSVTRIEEMAFVSCSGLRSVTIGNGVTRIEEMAFDGCRGLTNIVFMGNAPTIGSSVFSSSGCIALVSPKSTGWDVDVGEQWNGLTLQYWPEVMTEVASDTEVGDIVETFADKGLAAYVSTVAEYDVFRAWVNSNNLYQPAVVANANTWLSYALGADMLIEKEVISNDVQIVGFEVVDGGAMGTSRPASFAFEVAIDGIDIGSGSVPDAVLKENLKKVLGVEGAKSLSSVAFSSDNIDITFDTPFDGKAKFTVSPPADAGNSFFMRVKVK